MVSVEALLVLAVAIGRSETLIDTDALVEPVSEPERLLDGVGGT